jgi:predicted Zn-dependent protease
MTQHQDPLSADAIVERALAATDQPLTVIIERDERLDLRFAASSMTTNGTAHGTSVAIVAFDRRSDGRHATGTRSGTVRTLDEVEALVGAATSAAGAAEPGDDEAELPAPVDDGTWGRPNPGLSPDVLAPIAQALGRAFDEEAAWELFGYAEHTSSTIWLADDRGTRRQHRQLAGRIELNAKTHGRTRSAWTGASTLDFTDVDVASMIEELRRRVTWGEHRVAVTPGRHRVVLPPGAFADLVVPAHWSSASRDAREGRSAYAHQGPFGLGTQLAPSGWTIASDPHDARRPVRPFVATGASSAWASVFDNGLDLERVGWVEDGRLAHLVGSRAEQRHAPEARNGADNLVITPGGASGTLDELIARTEHGLLLTCLWYIREVDPQSLLSTGLTRDGVYVVRDGEIVGETGNFRFNESPLAMLGRVVDAGEAVVAQPREWADYVDHVVAPPVVVDDFNLSTASDAL